jgi:hypothetical protein
MNRLLRVHGTRQAPLVVICLGPLAFLAVTCPAGPVASEISREQAIEIARHEVPFEPDFVRAEQATTDGQRAVWRVTFRGRLPGQPPGLFETMIVEVDARTGDIVSLART